MSTEPKPRVLIVDDDEGLAVVIGLMLDRAGYEVHTVPSAEAAFDWLSQARPDVIILDLMMPEISGMAFLRQLRARESTRQLPVIVLTARVDDGSQREARKAGITGFLIKPVSRNVLIQHVERAIRQTARVA